MTEQDSAAHAAYERWRAAKLRSDRTMSFADCRETARAWVRFQNLYLGDTGKLPEPDRTVIAFPGLGGAA
jgi:hypothetical protein